MVFKICLWNIFLLYITIFNWYYFYWHTWYCFCSISGIVSSKLVYLYVKKYRYQKSYKKIVNNILLIVLILVVPIGLNIISLLSAETEYHLLMRYAWCLCYIYCIALLDKANIKSNIIKWLGILATLCIIGNYIIVDNIAYFNLYYKFQKSYSIAFKLSERIENYEGYNQNMPTYPEEESIAVINEVLVIKLSN